MSFHCLCVCVPVRSISGRIFVSTTVLNLTIEKKSQHLDACRIVLWDGEGFYTVKLFKESKISPLCLCVSAPRVCQLQLVEYHLGLKKLAPDLRLPPGTWEPGTSLSATPRMYAHRREGGTTVLAMKMICLNIPRSSQGGK